MSAFTCWRLNLHIIHRLHETRSGHEECTVADTPRCGDDLPSSSMQRFTGNGCIQNLELHIPDGLIAQGTLPGTPLETLQRYMTTAVMQVRTNLESYIPEYVFNRHSVIPSTFTSQAGLCGSRSSRSSLSRVTTFRKFLATPAGRKNHLAAHGSNRITKLADQ